MTSHGRLSLGVSETNHREEIAVLCKEPFMVAENNRSMPRKAIIFYDYKQIGADNDVRDTIREPTRRIIECAFRRERLLPSDLLLHFCLNLVSVLQATTKRLA